tara:strand:- start:29 stop:421 length:393 start_codon:yes stop_codon:yes gene_type:complete
METKPKSGTPEYRAWYYSQNQAKQKQHKKNNCARNKKYVHDYRKSNKCSKCEEDRWYLLEFHHIDPSTKFRNVCDMADQAYAISRVQEEIDKCALVCRNCHMEFHHLERQNIVRTFNEYLKTPISELKTT